MWDDWGMGGFQALATAITVDGVEKTDGGYTDTKTLASNNNMMHMNGMYWDTSVGAAATALAEASQQASYTNAVNMGTITNACYTSVDTYWAKEIFNIWLGGQTYSTQDCVDFASDGYTITGWPIFYRFKNIMTLAIDMSGGANTYAASVPLPKKDQPLYEQLTAVAPLNNTKLVTYMGAANDHGPGGHLGSVVQCYTEITWQLSSATTTAGTNAWYLFTAPEFYGNSAAFVMAGPKGDAVVDALDSGASGLKIVDLGASKQFLHFYAYASASTNVDNLLYSQQSDHVLFCGKQ